MAAFKDITYLSDSSHQKHKLDVYVPSGQAVYPVFVFIHGGEWYQGNTNLYEKIGVHLASKSLVAVVINYRSGEGATYKDMVEDAAHAVNWIGANIDRYKGLGDQLFLCGHSAGGHLAALLSLNKHFLGEPFILTCIKGCILLDAFGLNMDFVAQKNLIFFIQELRKVFTEIPNDWIDASPVHFIDNTNVPFLILTGERTYPYLTLDNGIFITNLDRHQVHNEHRTIEGRNHRGMLTALEDPDDEAYPLILDFVWRFEKVQ